MIRRPRSPLLLVLLSLASCAGASAGRPATWAVAVQAPGVENLFRVSDDLYRGAQPDREGFEALAAMGVRTVVNLRSDHTDDALVSGLGMDLVNIPMEPDDFGDEDVAAFLAVATDPARTPVFVHCRFGADRTGAVVGAYRIVVQGWTRAQAIEELTQGGYGYHRVWKLPVTYLETFDPASLASPGSP